MNAPEGERTPCPECGSFTRAYEVSASASATLRGELANVDVRRGVNQDRLAVGAFIAAISLGVWAASGCALFGLATLAVLVLIFALPRTRHLLMEGLHRLSGQ